MQTYILIANTSTFQGDVRVTLHFEDGTTAVRRYLLAPTSRTNVAVGVEFASIFRRFGSEVTIIVADAGVGIAYEEQSEVYKPFYRGSNSALGGSRGAGLGLTLVDQITSRHHGLVELDSRPGEGTRVALTLPGVS